MNRLLLLFSASLLWAACSSGPVTYEADLSNPILFSRTVKGLNDVVLENNFPPMIASRNYAYACIAAYESMAAGSPRYRTLAGQIKGLKPFVYADTAGLDFHYAALLSFVKVGNAVTFPEGSLMGVYEKIQRTADSTGMDGKMQNRSERFSDSVVAHILAWAKGDNYARLRSAEKYNVTDEEGRWQPTPPSYAQALEPHWREIRCLVMDSAAQFMPPPPPPYDLANRNSVYAWMLMEVKNLGDSLTDEQKHIADFWDDNPFRMNVTGHVMYATKKFSPAGHWMNIVGIACKEKGKSFEETIAAYTLTSICLFDGFISCWDEKFRSNYIRPEGVINKHIDPDWRPYIQTPPFPTYTSGHSVISAAAAEAMTTELGEGVAYRDTSLTEFGIAPRSFTSFRQAADEASISRLYGGIHYRADLVEGSKQGRRVGVYIVQKLKLKK